eukprot:CAMPEP_0178764290 /NCGR_PEP_ID=MMETSP0744-20121128/17709_1 /TAXON_ID=913974 /ORGANISM="Nitzschia punctata, Strain CCMP561" /LENGTH=554 /DNA_ID=CAMNT_0020419449 /DNA_START=48 /DNA_END=1712 /DNA_ORIENTATION=-
MTDIDMTDLEEEEEEDDEYEYEYEYEDSSDLETSSGSDSTSNLNMAPCSSANAIDATMKKPKTSIDMLSTHDLRHQVTLLVVEAAEALGISSDAAAPLLQCHHWSLQSLLQSYYTDPRNVLERAGVLHRCRHLLLDPSLTQASSSTEKATKKIIKSKKDCLICMEPIANDENGSNSLSMGCGHDFCKECWRDYLVNCIQEEGATCTKATCPHAGCHEVISETEVALVAADLVPKFHHYQLQSFVETNFQFCWCPGKGCDWVAKAPSAVVSSLADKNATSLTRAIQADCCACGTSFCFGCHANEPHIPVSCSKLALWKEKNQSEGESNKWILVNSKPCPKCGARIEKEGGCQYMTCRKCNHGFCWMCMGSHHVWQCNAYEEKDVSNIARAKTELERYLHYYERYHGHEEAQKFAQRQVDKLMEEEDSDVLNPALVAPSDMPFTVVTEKPVPQDDTMRIDLRLLLDANLQLVHCRRVLKYSYAFAFYHFDNNPSVSKLQKECFENHQGILERLTEGLSKATELPRKEMDPQDITNRTRVIGQFIGNVLKYVDNGMV